MTPRDIPPGYVSEESIALRGLRRASIAAAAGTFVPGMAYLLRANSKPDDIPAFIAAAIGGTLLLLLLLPPSPPPEPPR